MVNSKKMSKSSIAVIVLSILLVLSMVLGLTGAWFTDVQTGDGVTKDFGKIAITVDDDKFGEVTRAYNDTGVVTGKIMPGDTINYLLKVTADQEDAWFIVVLDVEGVDAGDATTALADMTEADVYSTNGTTPVEVTGELELDPTVYGEDYENDTITLNYTVYAIQKANVENKAAALTLFKSNLDFKTGLAKVSTGA